MSLIRLLGSDARVDNRNETRVRRKWFKFFDFLRLWCCSFLVSNTTNEVPQMMSWSDRWWRLFVDCCSISSLTTFRSYWCQCRSCPSKSLLWSSKLLYPSLHSILFDDQSSTGSSSHLTVIGRRLLWVKTTWQTPRRNDFVNNQPLLVMEVVLTVGYCVALLTSVFCCPCPIVCHFMLCLWLLRFSLRLVCSRRSMVCGDEN
jgi:hypothetical protein